MQRVVADANVLVSAALARSPQAPSVLTLDAALDGRIELVTSPLLLPFGEKPASWWRSLLRSGKKGRAPKRYAGAAGALGPLSGLVIHSGDGLDKADAARNLCWPDVHPAVARRVLVAEA
ncbi:MAG: PIN domain-containing protein [Solirubrobacteraceae bacterium]